MLLEVGRIIKPHGIRGEVIVDLVTNRPEERLAAGSVLSSDVGDMEVVRSTPHQNRWIVAFDGRSHTLLRDGVVVVEGNRVVHVGRAFDGEADRVMTLSSGGFRSFRGRRRR